MDAERAVIGSILRNPDVMATVPTILREEDFYSDSHQKIWHVLYELFHTAMPIDVIVLGEELEKRKWLSEVGGCDGLVEIYHETLTAANVTYYAQIVKEKAVRRQLIHNATEVLRACYEPSGDYMEAVAMAEQRINTAIAGQMQPPPPKRIEVASKVMDAISERMTAKKVIGLKTGFHDLDEIVLGLTPGNVTVVAGKPGAGKSSVGLCIAENVAYEQNERVYFATAEMTNEELTERQFAMVSEVDGKRIRKGNLQADEMQRLSRAFNRISGPNLCVEYVGDMDMAGFLGAVRRQFQSDNPPKLVVVDYMQLLKGDPKARSRQEEVSSVSRALKNLSVKYQTHVLAMAQLNRQSDNRSNNTPRMSDLRESGAIEQDASTVILVHRPEYYDPKDRPGEADIIVAKNRHGSPGQCVLIWQGQYTRFVSKSKFYQEEQEWRE